jgi:hypothetical protein
MGGDRLQHPPPGPAVAPGRAVHPGLATPEAVTHLAAGDGLAHLLHHGDAATIARTVSGIQSRHGNGATGRLVRAVISRKETGLADAAAVTRFVGEGRKLKANWVKLATPEARAKCLTDAALAELKTLKVPDYAVSVEDLGTNSGRFSFSVWTMRIGKDPFSGPLPTDAAIADLADTVLHESRHCEQWFRMARFQAGAGKTSAEIATDTQIPPRICDEAVKQPLSAAGVELTEAQGWWKTLTDLPVLRQAYETAATALEQVKANAASTKEQKDKATKDRDDAFAAYQAVRAKYVALPEEADAWKLGAAVTAGMLKP